MTRLVLVPSPFVGAGSWRATAEALPDAIAVDYGGVSGPAWYEGVAGRVAAQAQGGPWIAVLHSGAGGFAPALADASEELAGFIFVDAVRPYPGRSNIETARPELVKHLRSLTADGRLAPWNQWFDEDPLPRLIRDAEARSAFIRDLPRVPFAFLEAVSAPSDAWERLPAAYLQLTRRYEAQAAWATVRGWPVRCVRAHHLAMASDPRPMAAWLLELAAQLVA